MAIATLALCYDNGGVFEGVVKIRRGLAAKVVVGVTTFDQLIRAFDAFSSDIASNVNPRENPAVAKRTLVAVKEIQDKCHHYAPLAMKRASTDVSYLNQSASWSRFILWLLCAGYAIYAFSLGGVRESLGVNPNAGDPLMDLFQKVLAVLCLVGLSLIILIDQ